QYVVVLVGEGDLQILERLRPRELEGVVVVVEDEVAVQMARQPFTGAGLSAVGRRVAEEAAADLGEVDVGLADAAAHAPVRAWVPPTELLVLDVMDVFGDFLDLLHEI